MSRIQAVVFDLDDTLYPERQFAFSGFDAVAEAFRDKLGEPGKTSEHMRQVFDTSHRRRVFNEILHRAGLPDDEQVIREMIDVYRAHRPGIALYPDADAALDRLRRRRKLGLISDGPLVMQSGKVDALGLRDRVDEVILTDTWGRSFWKPHPRAFEEIAKRFGLEGSHCAYVADNPAKDFIAPRALGWLTVQVRREDGVYRDEPAAKDGQPDHIVAVLDHLDDVLSGA